MRILLNISELNAFYGKTQALFDINITLQEGGVLAVLGANGAGKTTLLRAVSGMVKCQGDISINGKSFTGLSSEYVARLGVAHVPQGRGTFSNMTVLENLQLGAAIRRDREGIRIDIEKVYEWFPRLAERRWQQAGTLSGGEQQMLAIGRALMSRPKLLLLDEPSFGLAPMFIEELFNVLLRVKNETGVAMLVVEQNARQALNMASHAFLLESGRIVLEGSSAALRDHDGVKKSYLGY